MQGITGSGEARECTLGLYLPTHGFRKVPLRMQCGPVQTAQARADAALALKQPTAILADHYEANTGPVEATRMGAVWTMHDSLRAHNQRKPSLKAQPIYIIHSLTIWAKQSSKNCTNLQRGHLRSLIRVFTMHLFGKQGPKLLHTNSEV